MNNLLTLLASVWSADNLPKGRAKKEGKCLYCGKPHNHNNSFCSVSCCSKWKRGRK